MNLGIVGIVNFNEWDSPNYKETGGINSVIKTIIPYLEADHIFLYGMTNDKEKLFVEKKINDKISVFPIVYIAEKSFLPKRVTSLIFGWRINRYLRSHDINFVYSHAEEFALWLSKRIPYIHHLHTFVNVLEVSGKRLAKVKILRQLSEKMRVRVIKRSYKIVAVNNDIVTWCQELIGRDRIIKFPNYVDFTKFLYRAPESLRKKYNIKNERVVLFIGRISMVKGMELFVDTVERLNQTDEARWVGIIVGNGDYEPVIRTYIQNNEISTHFVFAGSTNDEYDLCKFYSLADIFLVTSFSESVPLTLLESLSCGTPVVSTDVGICREVLKDGNGRVVDSRNPDEFAKAILLSINYKSTKCILFDSFKYSVENASALLNKELRIK